MHSSCAYLCKPVAFQVLKRYGVTTVVRVCDCTYDKTPLEKEGITVLVSTQTLLPPQRRSSLLLND